MGTPIERVGGSSVAKLGKVRCLRNRGTGTTHQPLSYMLPKELPPPFMHTIQGSASASESDGYGVGVGTGSGSG